MAAINKTITWTDNHEELVKKIVEKHADQMRMNDIMPFTTRTHNATRRENQSGAILFALMLAAGEIEEGEAVKKPAVIQILLAALVEIEYTTRNRGGGYEALNKIASEALERFTHE